MNENVLKMGAAFIAFLLSFPRIEQNCLELSGFKLKIMETSIEGK